MQGIALIIVLAVITEALIEYAKSIGKAITGNNIKAAITQIVAIVISVFMCFAADADLFHVVGITFTHQWIGVVLTGVLGSRGANYISDFIKKIHK